MFRAMGAVSAKPDTRLDAFSVDFFAAPTGCKITINQHEGFSANCIKGPSA